MARKIMSGIGVKSTVSFALFVWKLGLPMVTIISGQYLLPNSYSSLSPIFDEKFGSMLGDWCSDGCYRNVWGMYLEVHKGRM